MPAKTGGSHALAALVSMIVGTVLSKYVWSYAPPLAEAAAVVGVLLTRAAGVPFSRDLAGAMVVMAGLSFVWGFLYHVGRHG
jgi:hypothetical protein